MITLEEFRKLPDVEKDERYKEMSDHDKFLWRTSCPIMPVVVQNKELTVAQRKNVTEIRKRLLEEGKISQEEFDKSEEDA